MKDMAALPPAQKPKGSTRRSFAGARAVWALMLREMSTSYGRSPGGYIWAIAEPVAGTIFLTVIFSLFFNTPPIGNSFALFYATGIMTFTMFNDIHAKTAHALSYSRQLLAYPTVTFVDALLARFLLTLITQILLCYIIFGGAMLFAEGWIRIDILKILGGLALAAFTGLSIGSVNCYIFMKIPAWQQVWSVLMRPMFILSGVIMMIETVPQPYRDWLLWNPVVHAIGLVRAGMYEAYRPDYISVIYVALLNLVLLTIGIILLRRHYRDLLERN